MYKRLTPSFFFSTLQEKEFYRWSQFGNTLPLTRSAVSFSFAKEYHVLKIEWSKEHEHPMNFLTSLKKATEELHWNICLKTILLCLTKYLALDGLTIKTFLWNLSGCETLGWHFIATWGTSDSRKGYVLLNAMRFYF